MKKFWLLITFSFILLSGCSGNTQQSESDTSTIPSIQNEATITKNNEATEKLTLTEKYIEQIDVPYKYKLENGMLSNTEISEISDEYGKEWRKVADEYYNKILEKTDEYLYDEGLLKASVTSMKENWDDYSKQEKEDYYDMLISIHGGGTIVGPSVGKYCYELEKEWALKILAIAEKLHIE